MTADATALATRWCRTARGLDSAAAAAYLRSQLYSHPPAAVAEALDLVCVGAQHAQEGARELLVGFVDLLAGHGIPELVAELQAHAAVASRSALRTLLPGTTLAGSASPQTSEPRVPDYTGGRALSLGERKALARRPTRASLDKLAADPHPAVIRALLANAKLVEDDVVRLAARRPALPEVLAEVARTPRWAHRVRVRMAIVLNPDTPFHVAAPFLVLLMRPQLKEVLEASYLSDALRSAARELLVQRRSRAT